MNTLLAAALAVMLQPQFPEIQPWWAALVTALLGFFIGLLLLWAYAHKTNENREEWFSDVRDLYEKFPASKADPLTELDPMEALNQILTRLVKSGRPSGDIALGLTFSELFRTARQECLRRAQSLKSELQSMKSSRDPDLLINKLLMYMDLCDITPQDFRAGESIRTLWRDGTLVWQAMPFYHKLCKDCTLENIWALFDHLDQIEDWQGKAGVKLELTHAEGSGYVELPFGQVLQKLADRSALHITLQPPVTLPPPRADEPLPRGGK